MDVQRRRLRKHCKGQMTNDTSGASDRQTTGQTIRPARPHGARLPPLEGGDRLTRYEFEQCYQAVPQVKEVELIEGVVNMPSSIHHRSHRKPHAHIIGFPAAYCAATPGVDLGDNVTVRLDAYNEV
jgi:hypothetical protein